MAHRANIKRTLKDMMLTEPGSRVEGATEDVLFVLFEASYLLLRDFGTPTDTADKLAHQLIQRSHAALADRGYVVRPLDA